MKSELNSLYYEFEKPIKAKLNGEDIGLENEILDCELIGINSYPNEALTFSIVLDGCLYDYISPENIAKDFKIDNQLTLKDLVYNNNSSEQFVVFQSKYFIKSDIVYFAKEKNIWIPVVEYFFSIDWLYDNDKRHFVLLANGQYAFVPNHKIKLNGEKHINPALKKIRKSYIV